MGGQPRGNIQHCTQFQYHLESHEILSTETNHSSPWDLRTHRSLPKVSRVQDLSPETQRKLCTNENEISKSSELFQPESVMTFLSPPGASLLHCFCDLGQLPRNLAADVTCSLPPSLPPAGYCGPLYDFSVMHRLCLLLLTSSVVSTHIMMGLWT